jgi:hypothetical protein
VPSPKVIGSLLFHTGGPRYHYLKRQISYLLVCLFCCVCA